MISYNVKKLFLITLMSLINWPKDLKIELINILNELDKLSSLNELAII